MGIKARCGMAHWSNQMRIKDLSISAYPRVHTFVWVYCSHGGRNSIYLVLR